MKCLHCEEPLTKRAIQKSQKYCNRACSSAARVTRFERPCENCNLLTLNPRFCGSSCAAQRSNTGVDRWNTKRADVKTRRYRDDRPCKWCSNPTGTDAQFCPKLCRSAYYREIKAYHWLLGADNASDPIREIQGWLVSWLKELVDYTCQECGRREFHPTDGLPCVQIDHINGNNKDHRPENLKALCVLCHWRTPTYCGRNKKKPLDKQHEDVLC